MKYYKPLLVFGLGLILLFSCGGGNDDESYIPPVSEKIIPSNLTLAITCVGADADNSNGDGTGVIQCTASATNAVSYGFRFGNGTEVTSTTGNLEYTFTKRGTNVFTVYVYAYSKTGDYKSTSKTVTVYVEPILIFSDEFDSDGSPDSTKWGYDIGTGSNGWGNGESQYYTNRLENAKVENGLLIITAKAESYEGSAYTSSRLLTQGKFDFTYGRVEVKAKLPSGGGTWPAIWMLGANFSSVGWPACGEIDIMEHAGNRQGKVQSAMHTSSSFGNTVNHGSQTLSDVSTEFHVYALEWSTDKMTFSVDDVVHYRYNPATKNSDTWPYDKDQFIILNVAMGGGFGGTIDTDFVKSSMEIDYVRVYQ